MKNQVQPPAPTPLARVERPSADAATPVPVPDVPEIAATSAPSTGTMDPTGTAADKPDARPGPVVIPPEPGPETVFAPDVLPDVISRVLPIYPDQHAQPVSRPGSSCAR